jgi:hypothetical protein
MLKTSSWHPPCTDNSQEEVYMKKNLLLWSVLGILLSPVAFASASADANDVSDESVSSALGEVSPSEGFNCGATAHAAQADSDNISSIIQKGVVKTDGKKAE